MTRAPAGSSIACWGIVLAAWLWAGAAGAQSTPPSSTLQQQAVAQANRLETLNVKGKPADRIYVMDSVFKHIVDTRVNIFDRTTGAFLGMISTGLNAHVHLSKDGSKIYVMTKYFSRLTRGTRTDVIEVYDTANLKFVREIKVPAKTVSALNYHTLFSLTNDGRFLLVQNATPALSTTIVDTRAHQFVQEITATAPCWSAIPVPGTPRSFAAICSDGSLLRVNLDATGHLQDTVRSKPFFSPANDPIFIDPGYLPHGLIFVSFHGNVYTAKVNPAGGFSFQPTWSLLDAADRKEGWVPTGFNMLAVDPSTGLMYVLMHPHGRDGSQKEPAKEIWVFNLATEKRVARVPAHGAVSLSVTHAGGGRHLLTIDGTTVRVYDIEGPAPVLRRTIKNAGEAAVWVMGADGDVRD